jgi:hypothetical protein
MGEEEIDLDDCAVSFLRGVFAAWGIVEPTPDQMQKAVELLHLHTATIDGEAN